MWSRDVEVGILFDIVKQKVDNVISPREFACVYFSTSQKVSVVLVLTLSLDRKH